MSRGESVNLLEFTPGNKRKHWGMGNGGGAPLKFFLGGGEGEGGKSRFT